MWRCRLNQSSIYPLPEFEPVKRGIKKIIKLSNQNVKAFTLGISLMRLFSRCFDMFVY